MPSQKLNFQAYYQRSVQRQGYMGLNPYPTYNDSLSYSLFNQKLNRVKAQRSDSEIMNRTR